MAEIAFKSYCWSIGTTSYRTDKMNLSIEKQIQLMHEFRLLPENNGIEWRSLQSNYYKFLQENEFVKGEAPRPDKDAREKTSGLVDIGLLTKDRMLTESGMALLKICNSGSFSSNNFLEIASDSFLYLKQLLKTAVCVNNKQIRPFIILAFLLSKFDFLTKEEFTFFLPMCIDEASTQRVVNCIDNYRRGQLSIITAVYDVISSMDNYNAAMKLFLETKVLTPEIICEIGFNRKSAGEGKAYDSIFFSIFNCLQNIYLDNKDSSLELFNQVRAIKGNTRVYWKKLLFGKSQFAAVKKRGAKALSVNAFSSCSNIEELKKEFFKVLHSLKVQATLKDYSDLNKRYFKLSDCILFRDSKVEFDIVPKALFNLVVDSLYKQAFTVSTGLGDDIALKDIAMEFANAEKQLYRELSKELGVSINNSSEAQKIVYDDRYLRFNKLVDEKFDRDNLVSLLEKFEARNDSEITSYITDNADVPTLFEYVLGVAWYTISEKQGDILKAMNLSLDIDLLPKTHAGGGMADIVYKYNQNANFSKHTLLIEATLSDKTGQRIMEMEPVSRHLGEYIVNNKNEEAYCIFIPTYLNPNIISDFRMRKNGTYFANNGDTVDGLKIIPLQTSELKTILQKGIVYSTLHNLFEEAFQSNVNVRDWYSKEIADKI